MTSVGKFFAHRTYLTASKLSTRALVCWRCCHADRLQVAQPKFGTTALSRCTSHSQTRNCFSLQASCAFFNKQHSSHNEKCSLPGLQISHRFIHQPEILMDDTFHNKQIDNRFVILGKSALRSCLTEYFLQAYPNLSAFKIANIIAYVTKEILPHKILLNGPEDLNKKREMMYSKIGKNFADTGKQFILEQIKGHFPSKFTNAEIELYNNLADPAALLRKIAGKKNMNLEFRQTGWKSVSVFINESLVAEETASSLQKAEYNACLLVIRNDFMEDAGKIKLEDADSDVLMTESIGKLDGQRTVKLDKTNADNFGLFLKGGEKATIQTEKYWEYNYVEPVFIKKIVAGSPAALSGTLQIGDVILAVGDFTLKGVTLKRAVSMINQEDNVTLTVKYDPEVKLRDKIKTEFIERENKAFKETLKIDEWRKWHEANAETNPEKYLKMK